MKVKFDFIVFINNDQNLEDLKRDLGDKNFWIVGTGNRDLAFKELELPQNILNDSYYGTQFIFYSHGLEEKKEKDCSACYYLMKDEKGLLKKYYSTEVIKKIADIKPKEAPLHIISCFAGLGHEPLIEYIKYNPKNWGFIIFHAEDNIIKWKKVSSVLKLLSSKIGEIYSSEISSLACSLELIKNLFFTYGDRLRILYSGTKGEYIGYDHGRECKVFGDFSKIEEILSEGWDRFFSNFTSKIESVKFENKEIESLKSKVSFDPKGFLNQQNQVSEYFFRPIDGQELKDFKEKLDLDLKDKVITEIMYQNFIIGKLDRIIFDKDNSLEVLSEAQKDFFRGIDLSIKISDSEYLSYLQILIMKAPHLIKQLIDNGVVFNNKDIKFIENIVGYWKYVFSPESFGDFLALNSKNLYVKEIFKDLLNLINSPPIPVHIELLNDCDTITVKNFLFNPNTSFKFCEQKDLKIFLKKVIAQEAFMNLDSLYSYLKILKNKFKEKKLIKELIKEEVAFINKIEICADAFIRAEKIFDGVQKLKKSNNELIQYYQKLLNIRKNSPDLQEPSKLIDEVFYFTTIKCPFVLPLKEDVKDEKSLEYFEECLKKIPGDDISYKGYALSVERNIENLKNVLKKYEDIQMSGDEDWIFIN